MPWIWLTLSLLCILVALCLLSIGHLHNELGTLRRRHEAMLLSVTRLQAQLAARAASSTALED